MGPRHRIKPEEEADEALVEGLLESVRKTPESFPGVETLAQQSGRGLSELEAWFRKFFHATPDWILRIARVEAARHRLLESTKSLEEVGSALGYGDATDFEKEFLRHNGLSPREYRNLLGRQELEFRLPGDYPVDRSLGYLLRDPENRIIQRDGDRRFREALWLGDSPACIEVELREGWVRGRLRGERSLGPRAAATALAWLRRRLGLNADVTGFQGLAAETPELAPLLAVEPGLRIPQTGTPYEALIWAIVGQQVNLAFAYRLLNRVVERAGVPVRVGSRGETLFAPPRPEAVAELNPDALREVQFSRSKAEYLVGTARQITVGAPDLGALGRASATRAERELLALRGVGKWTARYILMRGFGFTDCVPVGDAGLVRGLMRLYGWGERPDPKKTETVMARFRPYRSLATFHLWQTLEDAT